HSSLGVTIDQRHDLLRRGRSDDMVLILCSPQLPYGGCGYQNHPPQKGIVPLSFGIDLPPGITSWYRSGRRYLPLRPGAPAQFQRKSGVLLLRLKAADSVPFGVQRLHGTLQYETDEPGKPRTVQTVQVEFQVMVAAHNATVAENEWPFGSHTGQRVKEVALAPLVPFQMLLFVIVCGISTCDI
ncbi:MAG TPA: hypothetical protein VGP65_11490, partial [Candidatus Angelobacter sp.]|nr:hypothetical protein [Candidatus Angelobacter sp.]